MAMQHATSTRIAMRRATGEQDVVKLRMRPGEEPVPVAFRFRARVSRSKIVPVGGVAGFWVSNRDTEEPCPAGISRADGGLTLGVYLRGIRMDAARACAVPGK